MFTPHKTLILNSKHDYATTGDTQLLVLPGGRGPLFEVAARPQRPSCRAEFSAKERMPTRLGFGPEADALAPTQPAKRTPKIGPKKKRGGAAAALRTGPGINPTSEGRRGQATPHTNLAA